MKKLVFLILIAVLAVGCAFQPLEHISSYEQLLGIDLRPYAEKNFLITPYLYSGEYTTIAIIDFKIMPEANLVQTGERKDYTGFTDPVFEWEVDEIETEEALDRIYRYCVEMGANALIDFEILEVSDNWSNIQKPVVVNGIRITGLAIRRDDLKSAGQ